MHVSVHHTAECDQNQNPEAYQNANQRRGQCVLASHIWQDVWRFSTVLGIVMRSRARIFKVRHGRQRVGGRSCFHLTTRQDWVHLAVNPRTGSVELCVPGV